jgi:hypothetical protein
VEILLILILYGRLYKRFISSQGISKRIISFSVFLIVVLLSVGAFGCSKSQTYLSPYVSGYVGLIVYVPEGSFQRDDNKKSEVVINRGFFMMAHEVTSSQFYTVTKIEVPGNYNNNLPAKFINWYHAIVFCNTLSLLENLEPVYSVSGYTDPEVWLDLYCFSHENDNSLWTKIVL